MTFFIKRKNTRQIKVGNVKVGGNAPVVVQSMTNTFTQDVQATVSQIQHLEAAGCEIARIAVPDQEAAEAISSIKEKVSIPIIADIHFDYRLAIAAVRRGADGLRLNPGNIGSDKKVKTVVDCAKTFNIPIRIGVNSGSLEKDILKKYNGASAEAMVESAAPFLKNRSPASCGCNRGRGALFRNRQVFPRHRDAPCRRYWRYDPCLFNTGSG